MFNDTDNKNIVFNAKIPAVKYEIISQQGAYGCRRSVGAGGYDVSSDRTMLCWHEGGMDIMTCQYDHVTNKWSDKRMVCKNNMTGKWDYHNYPVMIIAPNGKALIFYCIHSNKMFQLTPDEVHSVDTGYTKKIICEDQTGYPHPVVYKDTIYIFYSRNQEISWPYRPLCYIKSTDSGATWSEPVTVIDSGKCDPWKFDEVYQCDGKFAPADGVHPDRILLGWNMWGGPGGHAAQGNGAYFAYLSMEDEKMYAADGKCLGDTISYADMEKYCMVERTMSSDTVSHTITMVLCENLPGGGHIVVTGRRNPENAADSIHCSIYRDGAWQTEIIDDRTAVAKDIIYDYEKNALRLACNLSQKLVIYEYKDGVWQVESATDIPYANGANSVPYINFIKGYRKRCQLLLATIDNRCAMEDYSGKWPVIMYGEW